jgi:hypothetical protein
MDVAALPSVRPFHMGVQAGQKLIDVPSVEIAVGSR